jgi:hypothetical protein
MNFGVMDLRTIERSPNLQLPVQSVTITTKVVSLNPAHGEVYSIQHYVIKFVRNLLQLVVSSGFSGFQGPLLRRYISPKVR